MKQQLHILTAIVMLLLMAACSTTSRLPDDEFLYTGIKSIDVDDAKGTDAEVVAMTEVEAALSYAPNNSLFGSSTMRFPLPIGLWAYNALEGQELKGIKKWFFNTVAATPRTITSAAPGTRSKIATNILQNYGYFQGNVDYRLITDKKDPRKQKIAYDVHLGNAYVFDSIRYAFKNVQDSIVNATQAESFVHKGKQFSVVDLQNEKTRLTNEFHNNGFYFYRPDYIEYYADSINSPGKVKLLVSPSLSTPEKANRQWKFGRVSAFIRNSTTRTSSSANRSATTANQGAGTERSSNAIRGLAYDDTITYRRLTLAYQGKTIPVKSRIMFRNFRFWTGRQYNEAKVTQTLTELRNMNVFSNVQFTFTPHDTTDTCSVLDVRLDATMEKKISAELDFSFSQRSNAQIGPDASITFSKLNAFHNSETLALTLFGSYYWQTKGRSKDKINNLDTYEWGTEISLSYPWLAMPGFLKRRFTFPTSTKFGASFLRTNIAGIARMNQFSLYADYNFQTSRFVKHTFTPLKIEMTDLRELKIDTINGHLQHEQYYYPMIGSEGIEPSIQYQFTYDNSPDESRSVSTHFSATIKEAGNIVNGVSAICGNDYSRMDKKVFGLKYFQFIKAQVELRNQFRIMPKVSIATRLLIGVLKPYGNSESAPITELFYSGGANSVRGFAARSFGPGARVYQSGQVYFYRAGESRFEANAELRFPLFGDLNGALFVDAGNVWYLPWEDGDSDFPDNGIFRLRTFFKELALGTGFGFRYDLQFLVLRLDFGIGIHAPYDTGKKGYYNIRRFFKDGTTINFAVGYPF